MLRPVPPYLPPSLPACTYHQRLEIEIAQPYQIEQHVYTDCPIDSRFCLLLKDFAGMCPYMCPYVCPYMCPYMCPYVCLHMSYMCPYMCPHVCPYMCPYVSSHMSYM